MVVFLGKSDDAGFFYSPKRTSTHVAGRNFHARSNGVAPLREEHALCPLPSCEGRNRRGNGGRFLFNRNMRFTHPNENHQPHDLENKRSEYQQAVRIFEFRRVERPQSITFKNEMPMKQKKKEQI
ncbi:MAG: hypothetical protein LBF89_03265 [Bacteroidales bacterium]|nr:hypothetical protein [Bacteroidales bacterium]